MERTYVVKGPPEIYFRKKYFSRQRVAARNRPNTETEAINNKITMPRILRLVRKWWQAWFPAPEGWQS